MNEHVGRLVWAARMRERGRHQASIADLAGVDRSAVSRAESGTASPATTGVVARAAGVDRAALVAALEGVDRAAECVAAYDALVLA